MSVTETSIAAYREIQERGLLTKYTWEVYSALCKHGPATANELFRHMPAQRTMNQANITSRLNELRAKGVATDIDRRKCSVTGMTVNVWQVIDGLPVKLPKKPKLDAFVHVDPYVPRGQVHVICTHADLADTYDALKKNFKTYRATTGSRDV